MPLTWVMRALAIVVVWLAGCSFAFVEAPSPGAIPAASCTDGYVFPAIDTALAGGLVVAGIAGVTYKGDGNSSEYNNAISVPFAHIGGVAALAAALGIGISAVTGYRDVARCRELHAR